MFICITIFSGCRGEPPAEQLGETAEVKNVINKYLDAEQNNNYSYMCTLLTGEALAEAHNNLNRKQWQKRHINTVLQEKIVAPDLAVVYADITSKFHDPSFNDRYALNFYLINIDGHWLIYKVEPVPLIRPELSLKEIPNEAKDALKDYFSLSYELKKYHELDYLASQMLNLSSQSNYYRHNPPSMMSRGFEVQEIKSLGYSERYCIAEVIYAGGNNDTTINAVVDIVDVAGQWKIVRLDIIKQERGDQY